MKINKKIVSAGLIAASLFTACSVQGTVAVKNPMDFASVVEAKKAGETVDFQELALLWAQNRLPPGFWGRMVTVMNAMAVDDPRQFRVTLLEFTSGIAGLLTNLAYDKNRDVLYFPEPLPQKDPLAKFLQQDSVLVSLIGWGDKNQLKKLREIQYERGQEGLFDELFPNGSSRREYFANLEAQIKWMTVGEAVAIRRALKFAADAAGVLLGIRSFPTEMGKSIAAPAYINKFHQGLQAIIQKFREVFFS
jgi:hypothetical protein